MARDQPSPEVPRVLAVLLRIRKFRSDKLGGNEPVPVSVSLLTNRVKVPDVVVGGLLTPTVAPKGTMVQVHDFVPNFIRAVIGCDRATFGFPTLIGGSRGADVGVQVLIKQHHGLDPFDERQKMLVLFRPVFAPVRDSQIPCTVSVRGTTYTRYSDSDIVGRGEAFHFGEGLSGNVACPG